jgi:molybdopterin-guanine dinucleotide biosynthesis protein A
VRGDSWHVRADVALVPDSSVGAYDPPVSEPEPGFAAVVLAGGAARRLGGVDKPALQVGGARLLDRVLTAVADAEQVVVVGPRRPLARSVVWTREDPPGSGPAAALAAGLAAVTADQVVVLAADLPLLDADAVRSLRQAAAGRDGAVLVDDTGREQLLVGCWSTVALRAAVDRYGSLVDASLRGVLSGLDRAAVRTPGPRPAWLDCDTPDDVRRAEELL